MEPKRREGVEWLRFALSLARHHLRDRVARRQLMFYLTLATMGVAVFGLVIFRALAKAPYLLVAYWSFCFAMVLLMLLLALYDMLAVREEHREELKRLRKSILGKPPEQG